MNELKNIKNEIQETISDFNEPFTEYLQNLGLPVEGILAPIDERKIVIESIETEINKISPENREIAVYLTRFLSSIAAGLFDGALTYLWNETIKCLRKMIINYDLEYFYKVNAENNGRYQNLKTEDELASISDYDMLTTCNRMGLITDHVFEVFKHINYMRNHASAAHPTQSEIGAFDLLSWLDNCIKYAINAVPNDQAIKLKTLLYNMRKNDIPECDFEYIGLNIKGMPTIMAEDFLASIFGMYTDVKTESRVIRNIEGIAKYAWEASTENKKHLLGEKYGLFRKNGDSLRKERADKFLSIVGGLSYKDEESISNEIKETLANLMTAHNGMNNFYNEFPWARQLDSLIPTNGVIPDSILREWVKTNIVCYCGNGMGYREGVDENAEPYYKKYISNFDDKALIELLNLMDDAVFTMDLDRKKPNDRFRKLCNGFANRTKNAFIADALKYLANCNEKLSNSYRTTKYKELLEKVNTLRKY